MKQGLDIVHGNFDIIREEPVSGLMKKIQVFSYLHT